MPQKKDTNRTNNRPNSKSANFKSANNSHLIVRAKKSVVAKSCAVETLARCKAEVDALKRVTPKVFPSIIGKVISRVEESLLSKQVSATVFIGGSMAKGTYLAGDHDVDVFVRFSPDYDNGEISDILGNTLKSAFPSVTRVHGSRDYFHVIKDGYTFEFIPVLNVSSWKDARNVTDMSPLHVKYVTDYVAKKPWLADDIRLTKLFCKSAKVYGAESYIGGFSGHVIDLLNINYGGFKELLRAASKWKGKVVLDPENQLTSPLSQLNDAKTISPLVIVDPVQQDRNSAAALTKKAFDTFRERAAKYLASADGEKASFFVITKLDEKEFVSRHNDCEIVAVRLVPLEGKKDVVGAKCLKIYETCVQRLVDNEFVIEASTWEFRQEMVLILFAVRNSPLSKELSVEGPPIHKTVDVARFKAAHNTTFTDAGRIRAVERRRHREALSLLSEIMTSTYVKQRVKRASARKI